MKRDMRTCKVYNTDTTETKVHIIKIISGNVYYKCFYKSKEYSKIQKSLYEIKY